MSLRDEPSIGVPDSTVERHFDADMRSLCELLRERVQPTHDRLELDDSSRIAVIGGGPAGSFFAYFILDHAKRLGVSPEVDIYEPRDFFRPGPAGCNMCGGIVSESMVQTLAAEGIDLPPTVVQRGIDSYVLHLDVGDVRIDTPTREKRIAAVHRGAGPRGVTASKWRSFDGYLLQLAIEKGAKLIRKRVNGLSWNGKHPQVSVPNAPSETYDLLVIATGVNSAAHKLLDGLELEYSPPVTTQTHIRELHMPTEVVEEYFGGSMHVFLPRIPGLGFGALIPKGTYVTLCLLGRDLHGPKVQSFLDADEVKGCFPSGWSAPADACHCSPRINLKGAKTPFADRVVFIGDCGVTRLYKDGIGAAYRTAKAAAATATLQGIAAEDFRQHFLPVCRAISADNRIGKLIYAMNDVLFAFRFARRGVLRMVAKEQEKKGHKRAMSTVLWDIFTGSAPYRSVLKRTLRPTFVARFLWNLVVSIRPPRLRREWGGPNRGIWKLGQSVSARRSDCHPG